MSAPLPDLDRLHFTREQMRAVDRAAIEEYEIPGVVLMENASLALADACTRMIGNAAEPKVLILAGPGNNGGDGFALARHLHNRGASPITLHCVPKAAYKGDAAINLAIIERMGLPLHTLEEAPDLNSLCPEPAIIVDAIFGTGLDRPIAGPIAGLIRAANAIRARAETRTLLLAVDIPSGLDCDSGDPVGDSEIVIRADQTVTLAGRMIGFRNPDAAAYLGEVSVGDIGAPRELLTRFGELH